MSYTKTSYVESTWIDLRYEVGRGPGSPPGINERPDGERKIKPLFGLVVKQLRVFKWFHC